jgi:circadian clock protein KaiC
MTTERKPISKVATGISGLDQILNGGLPKDRVTLVTGNSGVGKTLLGIEFLVHGMRERNESAGLVTFEEAGPKVTENVRFLGFDLDRFRDKGELAMLAFHVEPLAKDVGYFEFTPFLVLLEDAIVRTGAKRVLIDTIEVLFGMYSDETTMRIELVKLMRWLEDHGVTTIMTGESGKNSLTRFGIEEYASDCVIVLDHRVSEEMSTRRLRVIKYRGSDHGTNEYPFLIGSDGFIVLPITGMLLNYAAPQERVATGVQGLDELLDGGPHRGSVMLISGRPGSGKTSIAMSMVNAACTRGEKCLTVLYEESPLQVERNMESIGINLGQWTYSGALRIWAACPLEFGLENHLATFVGLLDSFNPSIVAIDGLTAFSELGMTREVLKFIARKINVLKSRELTTVITMFGDITPGNSMEMPISRMVDAWIMLRDTEENDARSTSLLITKSRGIHHSNLAHRLTLSNDGVRVASADQGS